MGSMRQALAFGLLKKRRELMSEEEKLASELWKSSPTNFPIQGRFAHAPSIASRSCPLGMFARITLASLQDRVADAIRLLHVAELPPDRAAVARRARD